MDDHMVYLSILKHKLTVFQVYWTAPALRRLGTQEKLFRQTTPPLSCHESTGSGLQLKWSSQPNESVHAMPSKRLTYRPSPWPGHNSFQRQQNRSGPGIRQKRRGLSRWQGIGLVFYTNPEPEPYHHRPKRSTVYRDPPYKLVVSVQLHSAL